MLRRVSQASTHPTRARNPEEKKKRRAEILQAAEHLWLSSTYSDLSMNQVAREAKLAKGTLYLYFNTKEELFLALLGNHLRGWLKELLAQLEHQQPQTPEAVAELLIQLSLSQEPLRRLLVLLNTVIDPAVDPEMAQDFRRQVLRYILPIVELMPFERSVNLKVLMHFYALALGWQLVSSGPQLSATPTFLAMSPNTYPRPTFEEAFPVAFRAVVSDLTDASRTSSLN